MDIAWGNASLIQFFIQVAPSDIKMNRLSKRRHKYSRMFAGNESKQEIAVLFLSITPWTEGYV